MKTPPLFDWSISNVLSKQSSILEKARISFIYRSTLLALAIVLIGLPSLIMNQQHGPMIRSAVFAILLLIMIQYLIRTGKYRNVAHGLIITTILIIIVNSYVLYQMVNVVSIELLILVSLFAFFVLGQRWGITYSLIATISIVLFMGFSYVFVKQLRIEVQLFNNFGILFNAGAIFALIAYILWHFNSAYYATLDSLELSGQELKSLNSKLESAITSAEKSSTAKSNFLSTMSHEIRTPLNVVIGLSNVLIDDNPSESQRENLEVLKQSADNLLLLLNDLLDFTKLESGKAELEKTPFDLNLLAQHFEEVYSRQAKHKGISFEYTIDPALPYKLLGDPTRLTQIINNLLNNAVKFTDRGTVKFHIHPQVISQDYVNIKFVFEDTGIGISDSKVNEIFEPFTQGAAYISRKYGGTGLGLAIVKRLLELHGSTIILNSKEGQGSTFEFEIKYQYLSNELLPLPEPRIKAERAFDDGQLKILVAEDTMLNVLVLNKFMSKWNIGLAVAGDGQTAIRMHLEEDYDLILMDLQMPGTNGYQATKAIRALKDAHKANIPIVALTASDPTEVKEKVMAAGMNDLITKPFEPSDILSKIKKYTQK